VWHAPCCCVAAVLLSAAPPAMGAANGASKACRSGEKHPAFCYINKQINASIIISLLAFIQPGFTTNPAALSFPVQRQHPGLSAAVLSSMVTAFTADMHAAIALRTADHAPSGSHTDRCVAHTSRVLTHRFQTASAMVAAAGALSRHVSTAFCCMVSAKYVCPAILYTDTPTSCMHACRNSWQSSATSFLQHPCRPSGAT
jgi:hypothetical protein